LKLSKLVDEEKGKESIISGLAQNKSTDDQIYQAKNNLIKYMSTNNNRSDL
jgi:hypothetical protein